MNAEVELGIGGTAALLQYSRFLMVIELQNKYDRREVKAQTLNFFNVPAPGFSRKNRRWAERVKRRDARVEVGKGLRRTYFGILDS